jgi:hypothetical protein
VYALSLGTQVRRGSSAIREKPQSRAKRAMSSKMMFLVDTGNGRCVSHDGYIQLGSFSHSVEKHLELCPEQEWQVTYWMPDPFRIRYPRPNYQHTMKANEGSPRTDNATDSRPRDFPDQPTERLERTL